MAEMGGAFRGLDGDGVYNMRRPHFETNLQAGTRRMNSDHMNNPLPTPKFKIGDKVFYPQATRKEEAAGCPDCLDSRKWKVTLPSGVEFEVKCSRCQTYDQNVPAYKRISFGPEVKAFVVTADNVCTRSDRPKQPGGKVEYAEGGGGWWSEDRFFTDEAACAAKAREMADAAMDKLLKNDAETNIQHRLNTYGLNEVFAANEVIKRRAAEVKYENALEIITDLRDAPSLIDGFISAICDKNARRTAEMVSRHLLGELGENVPDDWDSDD